MGTLTMPRAPRTGKRALYLELPEDLVAAFEALAVRNLRSMTAEAQRALARHLEAEGVEPPPPPPPRKRGRPPKRR